MKWLFILFLIINIAFFSYSTYFKKQDNIMTNTQHKVVENKIVLLKEVDSNQLKIIKQDVEVIAILDASLKTIPPSPVIDRSNNVLSNQCFQLDPIDKESMDEVNLILSNEYKKFISFEIETTSPATYHRIYIPAQKDRTTIDDILKKLDDNGLNDHYVMTISGRKNAIALGVYKKRSTAVEIAKKVIYLGFSTTIEAISKDKNSLYNIKFLFKGNQNLNFYNTFLDENNLKSSPCKKMIDL